MTLNLSLLEQLCYSTTRIECETKDRQSVTVTGFFFNFLNTSEKSIPTVITNRHVAEGMTQGRFRLTKSDIDGNPINDQHFTLNFSVDFEKMWTFHPDPTVDLCAMPIGQLLAASQTLNSTLFFKTFDKSLIPNQDQLNDLDVVEDVLMSGYPNGIWDAHNNMPIVRKGTTASHPNIDYNGKKEFRRTVVTAKCRKTYLRSIWIRNKYDTFRHSIKIYKFGK